MCIARLGLRRQGERQTLVMMFTVLYVVCGLILVGKDVFEECL